MVVRIIDFAPSADTADDGIRVFPHLEAPLRHQREVVVSFEGINTATSSFVNTAFVPLIRLFGFDEIKNRMRIVNSTRQINEMIRIRLRHEAERAELAA